MWQSASSTRLPCRRATAQVGQLTPGAGRAALHLRIAGGEHPQRLRAAGSRRSKRGLFRLARRAAKNSPNSAFARIAEAFDTWGALAELPKSERSEAVSSARESAKRAIEIAPEFGDTYSVWCFLHSETLKLECENWLLRGKKADADSPFLDGFLSSFYVSVGRFAEANELGKATAP